MRCRWSENKPIFLVCALSMTPKLRRRRIGRARTFKKKIVLLYGNGTNELF